MRTLAAKLLGPGGAVAAGGSAWLVVGTVFSKTVVG